MRNRLRTFVWGTDLGRTRRYLVLTILHVALLGLAANWAQPRINAWLYPPPPPPPQACTRISVFISVAISPIDVGKAKKWVGEPNASITLSARVWNPKNQRVEFWMTDGTTMWKLELICYDTSAGHYMVYGEFEKESFQEVVNQEKEYLNEETGNNPPQP